MKIKMLELSVSVIFLSFITCDFFNYHPPTRPNTKPNITRNRCNELAGSQYLPTILGEIIALGRDSSGTIYIVDEIDKENTLSQGETFITHLRRAFISKNDTLYRHHIRGSGIMSEKYYSLGISDIGQFVFKNDSGKWSSFYLCRGDEWRNKCAPLLSSKLTDKSKGEEQMEEGWQLMCDCLDSAKSECILLTQDDTPTASDLSEFVVMNYPPVTHVEYLASLKDSTYLLVTREENDWNGDAVVHYGKKEDLKLREMIRFARATDGGSTWIDFMIDSQKVTAVFRVKLDTSGFSSGPAYLVQANDTLPFERLAYSKELLSDFGFDCDHEVR